MLFHSGRCQVEIYNVHRHCGDLVLHTNSEPGLEGIADTEQPYFAVHSVFFFEKLQCVCLVQKKKIAQYLSHQIFGHMHGALNAIEKITNDTV